MSSYPEDVKASIEQLVSIMGGRYTTSMSKKNSHLLIRAAAGPKFAGCAARGVVPVTADWLIESAHAGIHKPKPMASIPNQAKVCYVHLSPGQVSAMQHWLTSYSLHLL